MEYGELDVRVWCVVRVPKSSVDGVYGRRNAHGVSEEPRGSYVLQRLLTLLVSSGELWDEV